MAVATGRANGSRSSGDDARPRAKELLAARKTRSFTRITFGLLVSTLAVVGVAAKFREAGDRDAVLVVAREVAEGAAIQEGDLRQALVAPDPRLKTVPATDRARFIGKIAAADLFPGTTITEASVARGPSVAANQTRVGATLRAGRFPANVRAGDVVRLLHVPARADTAAGSVVAKRAVVRRVAKNDHGLGTTDFELIVDEGDYVSVAGASAREELVIVGLGPDA